VLKKFLENKPLFYETIDYARMPRVYARVKAYFNLPKVIHIIGTNGKGTTGRFLATALVSLGFKVGHYTSPHILEFNERIWLNGASVSDALLEKHHIKLLQILTKEEADALSYFEYTTLLAMLLYSDKTEVIILEAGLGGEYDATSVFENELTLVTPIDRDHEAFLGDNIEAIARTKLNAIKKTAIIAKQKYNEIYNFLREISKKKHLDIFSVEELITEEDINKIKVIAKKESLAIYLQENLTLAIAALKFLEINYEGENFKNSKLFGRLTSLNSNILVDVGHNVLAAEAIYNNLKDKKYILVYNSYKDKNYKKILTILKPIISHVELIDVYNSRIEEADFLQKSLDELEIKYNKFENIIEDEKYLVFGSFSVVEAFMRRHFG